MALNLGINLLEVDGATPALQGAPTSVAGFVVRTQRGVPGVVQEVSNFTQFTNFFGGYVAAGNTNGTQTSFVGAYAVRGFFDNGGALAYVLRIVDTGTAKAGTQTFNAAAAAGGAAGGGAAGGGAAGGGAAGGGAAGGGAAGGGAAGGGAAGGGAAGGGAAGGGAAGGGAAGGGAAGGGAAGGGAAGGGAAGGGAAGGGAAGGGAAGGGAAGGGAAGGGAAGGGAAGGGAAATPALTVTAANRGVSDPGGWSSTIGVKIVANTSNPNVTDAFDLIVAQISGGATPPKILESWTKISMSGKPGYQLPAALNDPNTGSQYIMVAASGTAPPAPTSGYSTFSNGADDTLTGATLNTALAAPFSLSSPFDAFPIQLLACPESADTGVVSAALTYCSTRGDCMFVGHVPDGGAQPLAAAKTYGQGLQNAKVYGALYLPYIQIVDPIGTLIWIPPTGHVLGVYARTALQRGIWKAPAGNGAVVNNALNVRATLNDTDHTDLVKNGSVNAIRPIPGAGIVIDSSRTLSTNTLWLYVNVRLLFNYVETSLKNGLRWVVQEPNDPTLWNKIKYNSVTPFLMGLWSQGAFGPGAAKDVFTVKVDSENNPPPNIQQGLLTIEVYFYPSRPAETILIIVGQQEGGATVTES